MKKNYLLLAILLVLAGVSVIVLFKKKNKSTLNEDEKSFAFADTALITKVVITEKKGKTATIERKDGKIWFINNKYPARKDAIDLILYTLKRTEVKYPATGKAKETIIKSISTEGLKVEFFSEKAIKRIWYIGASTPDQLGTFMVLADPETDEKYETAYVTWIPGFEGFLNTRFFTNEGDWRNRTVLALSPPEIEQISMKYTDYPDSSFSIKVLGNNKFLISDFKNQPLPKADTLAIKQYLAYFTLVEADTYLTGIPDREGDSVKRTIPFATLSVKSKAGHLQEMKLFRKKAKPVTDAPMPDITNDPDLAFMLFNKDQDFALIQYYVFGKMLQTINYFQSPITVKK